MSRRILVAIAALLILPALALGTEGRVSGPDPDRSTARGQIVVKFRAGVSEQEISRVHTRFAAKLRYRSARTGWQALDLRPGEDPGAAVARYRRTPGVESVEYVAPRWIERIPNDLKNLQCALHNTGQTLRVCATLVDTFPCAANQVGTNVPCLADEDIDAPEAWDLATGKKSVIVAVLDTGVDATRSDLSPRVLDGRDFVNNDNFAFDDHGHGTAVASIIGAIGNNKKGMTGINWKVKILPVKVCDAGGGCPPSDVLAGVDYAVNQGADILNLSLSCDDHRSPINGACGHSNPYCFSAAEQAAYTAARNAGVTVVAAAGNCGGWNDDATASYPCSYDIDGLICAGATTSKGTVANFSNEGPSTVDIGAPGYLVLAYRKTPPGGNFFFSGTSAATPVTAGVAALLLSRAPFTPEMVHQRILEGGEDSAKVAENYFASFEGGRVNAFNTLKNVFVTGKTYSTAAPGDVNLIADLNGDQRGDLVRGITGVGFRVSLNSARKTKFVGTKIWSAEPLPSGDVLAGDVTGNGKDELILADSSGFRVLVKKAGDKAFKAPVQWSAEAAGSFNAVADVNDDQMEDLIRYDGDFDVLLSNGAGFNTPVTWSAASAGDAVAVADVNGDGMADLINWFEGGGNVQVDVMLSTGSTFSAASTWFDDPLDISFAGAGDHDGDGMADLLGVDNTSGCLMVMQAGGSSFEDEKVWGCHPNVDMLLTGRVGKDRDARVDVVGHTTTGQWKLHQSRR